MTTEEHETTVTLDYEDDCIRFYTTRQGEYSKLKRRLEPVWDEVDVTKRRSDGKVVAWDLVIPADYCSGYLATLTKTSNRLSEG